MFRVETPRELANWSRNLVQGAHDAATLIKEINCGKLKIIVLKFKGSRKLTAQFLTSSALSKSQSKLVRKISNPKH